MVRARELGYDRNATAWEMAQEIFGDGVSVLGASYSGDRNSSAIYSRGDSRAPGVTPGDATADQMRLVADLAERLAGPPTP